MHYLNSRRLTTAAAAAALAASIAGSAAAFPLTTSNLLPIKPFGMVTRSIDNIPALSVENDFNSPDVFSSETPGAFTAFSVTADSWQQAWASDPTLQFSDWNDVFNVAQLAEFEVPLRSDPSERTNILLSAKAVDNIALMPGQVFSFNDVVGERTTERGFQDGWMFEQGKLVRGSGGGICLVATAIYNAALEAGLGLVERHPHSGLVSYAPPGCDASVVYGSKDLRFKNTTSAALTIRTAIAPDRVKVKIFGVTPPPGYQVMLRTVAYQPIPYTVIEKPDPALQPGQTVVEQKAHTGFNITLERIITKNGKVLKRETVASERRAPSNKIVRVAMQKIAPLANPLDDSNILPPAPTHSAVPPSDNGTSPATPVSSEDSEN